MKILFIDIDDVFVLDKNIYLYDPNHISVNPDSHYKDYPYAYTHDPYANALVSNLFHKNEDLFGVLHSTWRTLDHDWVKKHFEIQGCYVRWHDDFATSEELGRYESIAHWLSNHSEISRDKFAIIDDVKPTLDFKTRTIKIDPQYGFGHKQAQRLIQLLNLKH